MGTADRIVHLVLGPAEHGVTRHALDLAHAAGQRVVHLPAQPSAETVVAQVSAQAPGDLVHAHVTDQLWGATPALAAQLVEQVAATRPLTLTLHDLPQASDGAGRHERRRSAYARMVRAGAGVQVSSRYERELLWAIDSTVDPAVIALPVPNRPTVGAGPPPGRSAAAQPTVGVLGYLYPGKGHEVVLQALDRLGRSEVALVALGRPSVGHEWLVDDLTRLAGRRPLRVTGYLDEAELDRQVALIDVPVMAPTHVSSSASVHRWIGSGRRPVALRTDYTSELAANMPGCVRLTDDLAAAIGRALDDPADTWLDTPVTWDVAAAAAAQTAAILNAAIFSAAERRR